MQTQSSPEQHTAQSGSILITIMVVLFVLSSILAGTLTLSTQYLTLSTSRINSEQALYVAEAGLEAACAFIEENGIASCSGSGTVGGGTFNYKVKKNDFYQCSIVATGAVDGITRILELTGVRNASYAEFSFWTDDNGNIYFASGDHFSGKVHTGTKPYFQGSPEFESEFTTQASTYSGNTNSVTFGKGYEYGVEKQDMSEISLSDMKTYTTTNSATTALLLTGATDISFDGTQVKITNKNEGWNNYALTLSSDQLIYIEDGYITTTTYATNSVTTYTTNWVATGEYTTEEVGTGEYTTEEVITGYTTEEVATGEYTTEEVFSHYEWVTVVTTNRGGHISTKKEKVAVYETVSTPVYETVSTPVYETVTTEIYETVSTEVYEAEISSSTDTSIAEISTQTEWSDGTLTLNGGQLDGRLTIATEDNIYINESLKYALDPLDTTATDAAIAAAKANGEDSGYYDVVNDALGLVSGSDVIITTSAPDDIRIDASILVTGDSVSKGYNKSGSYLRDGCFVVDQYDVGGSRGDINLLGGIIQKDRGPVGLVSGVAYSKNYAFDTRFSRYPPPYFPTLGEGITFETWTEVNSDS